ncbi:RrF2 family transcriptional regulator [Faecalicatena contorta]|uniref:Rrf2 family protein n=1 Tax=Faecalicatena contorta TaxID=39482 RepID=A0A316A3C6_9FIRM|nr:Rrf2 family transcriptional regulator [Faecalicatena contorta]PWJ51234.1 BadM/Rrf2 family transcriptional regulator [Faecalicatena contorta]SUQ12790.1 Rrf2 family protein [Faecalicatena contorta]
MRFQITTDYAIRMLLFMAQREGQVSTAEVAAKELGITYSYFNKVAYKIRMAGFLESIQGPGGGYCISKNAADITLYDIVTVMEGDIRINRCLEEDGFCSRNATQICPVHKTLEALQNQMIDTLKSVRISDLCDEKQPGPIKETMDSTV